MSSDDVQLLHNASNHLFLSSFLEAASAHYVQKTCVALTASPNPLELSRIILIIWGRHAVRAEQVVTAVLPDFKKIVFRRNFAERQDLGAVRLTVRYVHKNIVEVTQPFRVAQSPAASGQRHCCSGRIGHIQDVTCVLPVLIILAAEQRRRLIQSGNLSVFRCYSRPYSS